MGRIWNRGLFTARNSAAPMKTITTPSWASSTQRLSGCGPHKDTDQWTQPWRSEEDRSNRIRRDLTAREDLAAARRRTRGGHDHRRPGGLPDLASPTSSVNRRSTCAAWSSAVTTPGGGSAARCWTGPGLTGRRGYGAQWIRVDVWRTNKELHAYYERPGLQILRR